MIPAKVFSRRELLRRERKSTITNSRVVTDLNTCKGIF